MCLRCFTPLTLLTFLSLLCRNLEVDPREIVVEKGNSGLTCWSFELRYLETLSVSSLVSDFLVNKPIQLLFRVLCRESNTNPSLWQRHPEDQSKRTYTSQHIDSFAVISLPQQTHHFTTLLPLMNMMLLNSHFSFRVTHKLGESNLAETHHDLRLAGECAAHSDQNKRINLQSDSSPLRASVKLLYLLNII